MILLGTNSIKDTGYDVANSCRFNVGDAPVLSKTSGTPTNALKWTFSAWVKISGIGNDTFLLDFNTDANNRSQIGFQDSDKAIIVYEKVSGSTSQLLQTSAQFRDPSAWLNIVVSCDRTLGTDTERTKIYVNGTRLTSFSTADGGPNYPAQDTNGIINTAVSTLVGKYSQSTLFYDGYLAEVVFIDGSALAPTSFGEFDEDSPTIWKPIDVSGLTFGTNGFYLDFEDSANLGNDANGGTDFTATNLAAADQATDTPTNNFCTMNPLQAQANDLTFAEGNCKITNTGNTWRSSYGTLAPSSGKWYFEVKCQASSDYERFGIVDTDMMNLQSADGRYDDTGYNSRGYGYGSDGQKTNNGGSPSWGNAWGAGDILACAYDLDNGKLYFSKGGTFQESGDPTSGSTGTGSAYDIDTGYFYIPALAHYGSGSSMEFNFGGCSAFTVSSANQDGNGYGNFEYAVPSGYLALCTKNLGSDGG